MKRYISLITWVDVTDGHQYAEGDPFPHDGRAIPEKRLDELSGEGNQTGRPVIMAEEVPDEKPKAKKDK